MCAFDLKFVHYSPLYQYMKEITFLHLVCFLSQKQLWLKQERMYKCHENWVILMMRPNLLAERYEDENSIMCTWKRMKLPQRWFMQDSKSFPTPQCHAGKKKKTKSSSPFHEIKLKTKVGIVIRGFMQTKCHGHIEDNICCEEDNQRLHANQVPCKPNSWRGFALTLTYCLFTWPLFPPTS